MQFGEQGEGHREAQGDRIESIRQRLCQSFESRGQEVSAWNAVNSNCIFDGRFVFISWLF